MRSYFKQDWYWASIGYESYSKALKYINPMMQHSGLEMFICDSWIITDWLSRVGNFSQEFVYFNQICLKMGIFPIFRQQKKMENLQKYPKAL